MIQGSDIKLLLRLWSWLQCSYFFVDDKNVMSPEVPTNVTSPEVSTNVTLSTNMTSPEVSTNVTLSTNMTSPEVSTNVTLSTNMTSPVVSSGKTYRWFGTDHYQISVGNVFSVKDH